MSKSERGFSPGNPALDEACLAWQHSVDCSLRIVNFDLSVAGASADAELAGDLAFVRQALEHCAGALRELGVASSPA